MVVEVVALSVVVELVSARALGGFTVEVPPVLYVVEDVAVVSTLPSLVRIPSFLSAYPLLGVLLIINFWALFTIIFFLSLFVPTS